ncbi:hypothetical protein FFWV33_10520 [Flavobacterium faecale]|uniref:DUF3267 domain-containing protein n=1 Tax=Flavobacterium faecale TaxID=1355330 RepID=A0A2S1LDY6_9FLAO|nr:DUF3267 domain-containing protein [Flavobacterium faecale]AWG21927.1 hypothetical protein FFWV33_10520 [Flavobacterium faecale]
MQNLDHYKKDKLTINIVKANIYGIFGAIPIVIVYLFPFLLLWKDKLNPHAFRTSIKEAALSYTRFEVLAIIMLVITLGIVVHELIHGITWAKYTKKRFKSIKFGFLWKMLTPYCHCTEPLRVKEYITGAIMPAIILGFLPAIYAILFGNIFVLLFAILFTVVAIGDFMIINLLRKEDMNSLVLDHPSEAGCFIYRK